MTVTKYSDTKEKYVYRKVKSTLIIPGIRALNPDYAEKLQMWRRRTMCKTCYSLTFNTVN